MSTRATLRSWRRSGLHRSTRQHLGRLGSQAGLHSFPVLHSDRPGFSEGSDPEDRTTGVPHPLPSWSTFSHTPYPYWRGQSAVPLETRLVQKRLYHRRSVENGSLSTSGQLPTPNRATTVSIVSTLRRQRRDSTASAPVLSGPHAGMHFHLHQPHGLYRPTTHHDLPGDDWGGDTPPWPGMREREVEWRDKLELELPVSAMASDYSIAALQVD